MLNDVRNGNINTASTEKNEEGRGFPRRGYDDAELKSPTPGRASISRRGLRLCMIIAGLWSKSIEQRA